MAGTFGTQGGELGLFAHASVHELAGNFADPSDWFHDDRGQRAQASVAAG